MPFAWEHRTHKILAEACRDYGNVWQLSSINVEGIYIFVFINLLLLSLHFCFQCLFILIYIKLLDPVLCKLSCVYDKDKWIHLEVLVICISSYSFSCDIYEFWFWHRFLFCWRYWKLFHLFTRRNCWSKIDKTVICNKKVRVFSVFPTYTNFQRFFLSMWLTQAITWMFYFLSCWLETYSIVVHTSFASV